MKAEDIKVGAKYRVTRKHANSSEFEEGEVVEVLFASVGARSVHATGAIGGTWWINADYLEPVVATGDLVEVNGERFEVQYVGGDGTFFDASRDSGAGPTFAFPIEWATKVEPEPFSAEFRGTRSTVRVGRGGEPNYTWVDLESITDVGGRYTSSLRPEVARGLAAALLTVAEEAEAAAERNKK